MNMRHKGILRKQHGVIVTPFRLLIFKVFFIQGEILEYIHQFYFYLVIMMRTVSEKAGSPASQTTIGSYSAWFMRFTGQRFLN